MSSSRTLTVHAWPPLTPNGAAIDAENKRLDNRGLISAVVKSVLVDLMASLPSRRSQRLAGRVVQLVWRGFRDA
jgi:hypothetical protein